MNNICWGFRSLEDLTKHLTTRADDSHAAPVLSYYIVSYEDTLKEVKIW